MKKILNYLAGVAMMAFCVFGISACGSDDNNPTPNRPLQMNGEWVCILKTDAMLYYEIDKFNGSAVEAIVYNIYGSNLLNGNKLNEQNVKKIEKFDKQGSFTYKDGTLTATFSQSSVSGPVKYGNDIFTLYWTVKGSDFEFIRPTKETGDFQDQAEAVYQTLNAK